MSAVDNIAVIILEEPVELNSESLWPVCIPPEGYVHPVKNALTVFDIIGGGINDTAEVLPNDECEPSWFNFKFPDLNDTGAVCFNAEVNVTDEHSGVSIMKTYDIHNTYNRYGICSLIWVD